MDERELADLVALADGKLTGRRRDQVEARVRASPELEALVAEQREVAAALHAVDVGVPAGLRAEIAAKRERRSGSRVTPRRVGVAALAACAAAVVVVVALPGSPGRPRVSEAARFAMKPAALPAPARDSSHAGLLKQSVEGIPFPDWGPRFGWRAAGARSDTIGGDRASTVFYVDREGRRLAYTIVGGSPLKQSPHLPSVRRGSAVFRAFSFYRRRVVTWVRDGHTCVLSAADVRVPVLVDLASSSNASAGRY